MPAEKVFRDGSLKTIEDYVGDDGFGDSWACARCRASAPQEPMPQKKPVWVNELTMHVRTGDIVLFSSKNHGANLTKFFTNSWWDHIGVVVKPMAGRAYLVEWGGGLFASELVERLTEYHERDARAICIRQLKLGRHRERQEDQMEEFIDMLFREQLGRNTLVPFDQVTRAGLRQWKKVEERDAVIDDLTTLFCSKTVAVVYKSVGLVDHKRDAADFLPKHFAYINTDFLDLKLGASLGPEIRVTFESAAMRTAVSALLAISGIDLITGQSKQRKAALAIQSAARRVAATRARDRRRKELGLALGPLGRAAATARAAVSAVPEMVGSRATATPSSASRASLLSKGTPAREERAMLLKAVSSASKAARPLATSAWGSPMDRGPANAGAIDLMTDSERDDLVGIADRAIDAAADEALHAQRSSAVRHGPVSGPPLSEKLPGKLPSDEPSPLGALGSLRELAFGSAAK